jgi:hypothetical protein
MYQPSTVPSLNDFMKLSDAEVFELVYPHQLGVSLLINGTRRWYVSEYMEAPPEDDSYLLHYLQVVLDRLGELYTLLAANGVYRVFIPVYSEDQKQRHVTAHHYLMQGIAALSSNPQLIETYHRMGYDVRFYGDMAQHFRGDMEEAMNAAGPRQARPRHYLYYGASSNSPYNHLFELVSQFSAVHSRPPTWDEMVELYYEDATMKPLDILIGFNRIYARMGVPALLDGAEQIYTTLVTPLVLSQKSLRNILYDYLFHQHDAGRDYKDIRATELHRLREFYTSHQDTIIGLSRKHENLVYPSFVPEPVPVSNRRPVKNGLKPG